MRKRFISAALALALSGSLLTLPAQAATPYFTPDNPVVKEPTAEVPESTADSAAKADTPYFTPDNPPIEEPAAEAAGSTGAQTEAETEVVSEDPEGTVSFENLEKRLRENNVTLLMLQETIEVINSIDYEELADDLRAGLRGLAQAQWGMLQAENADSMMGNSSFSSAFTSQYIAGTLDSQYASLRETFEDLKEGKLQADNEDAKWQLQHTQNQLVMGGETLYIAILELQNTHAGLLRQMEAMNRTVQEMELRYKFGQISALTLQQVKNGQTQLSSGIATLEMNLQNLTCQLETMLGLSPTGTLVLTELPQVSDEQISKMNYDDALITAKEQSYELHDAQKTLNEAEETFRTDKKNSGGLKSTAYQQALHTFNAAKYTHMATTQNFELAFRTTYAAVADYQQVLKASESALEYQKASYAATELKYRQGSISKNALLTAQDELATAENTVLTAKHNLFTAYHNYLWAVEHGIMN